MKWEHFPDISYNRDRDSSMDKVERIRKLHSPIIPPDGMALIGSKIGQQYCAGCDCGDHGLAVEWPCETREICDDIAD